MSASESDSDEVTVRTVVLLSNPEGRRLVAEKCQAGGVPMEVFEDLLREEVAQQGRGRRHGLSARYDEILDAFAEELDAARSQRR